MLPPKRPNFGKGDNFFVYLLSIYANIIIGVLEMKILFNATHAKILNLNCFSKNLKALKFALLQPGHKPHIHVLS